MAIAYWLSNSYIALLFRSWSMVSVTWLAAFIAVQFCTRVANQGCEYTQCMHTHTEWCATCFESQHMYGDNAFYCLQRCNSCRISDQHATRLTVSMYYCHVQPKLWPQQADRTETQYVMDDIIDKIGRENSGFSASNSRNTNLQNRIFNNKCSDSVDVRKADFCNKFSQLNLSPKFGSQI